MLKGVPSDLRVKTNCNMQHLKFGPVIIYLNLYQSDLWFNQAQGNLSRIGRKIINQQENNYILPLWSLESDRVKKFNQDKQTGRCFHNVCGCDWTSHLWPLVGVWGFSSLSFLAVPVESPSCFSSWSDHSHCHRHPPPGSPHRCQTRRLHTEMGHISITFYTVR